MEKLFEELQAANISLEQIEKFLSKGKLLHVKNQSVLVQPGTICNKAYVVNRQQKVY